MSVNPDDVVRPLGAVEEFLWVFDHSSPKQFCLIGEVDGPTRVSEWRVALDALQQRHPMLSVCIDSTYNRVPHFVRATAQPIPLRIAAGETTWEREAEREIRTPFDPTKAPLGRVVLIHKSDKTFVMLVLHHSIGDGASSAFLLRDLLKALSGEKLKPQVFPRSLDEIVGVPIRTSSEPGIVLSHDLAKILVQATVHVKSSVVSSELTRKLQERARQESTTIHGILCAAIAVAGREINSTWCDNPLRIFSPVNIRGLLGLNDECVDAFSKAVTVIEMNATANIWELARFVRSTLLPFKTAEGNAPVIAAVSEAMATNMNVVQGLAFNRAAFSEELMVSNLGKVPFEPDFGRVTLKSLWAPVFLRGHEHEQTIGAASINGSIHLVHTSWTPLPDLLERIEEKLEEACLLVPVEA